MTLPGYIIAENIHQGQQSLIYRGTREQDGQPVVIKTLSATYPALYGAAKLKQEYEIAQLLDSPHIVKAYDLLPCNNAFALIVEDFGGVSLGDRMAAARLDIGEALTIAIALADGLGAIHQHHIIHKDLKPSNVIINEQTGQVKISDFGISSFLSRETQADSRPEFLEGTLLYMSPEQTGRINRPIDYRSDFYSLGVLFYEMLTGAPPFQTDDRLELIHSHIARMPEPPHHRNANIPPVLSAIVLKLLAKSAEERYLSAYGLKMDLVRCHNQLTAVGDIAEFPLGTHDISSEFRIPQTLYGREQELATLAGVLERVIGPSSDVGNPSELILVTGYAGIGKTALVQEIQRQVITRQGYFVAGKADQLAQNIPYHSIVQAFQDFVRQLLTETQARIIQWKDRLSAALGPNGGVISEMIPEIELILGPQPKALDLTPTEAQHRFNDVLKEFLRTLAQPEHPLVILLDNLQWADSATLKLLQLLFTGADIHHLCVIGVYRDHEVGPQHPIMSLLTELRTARRPPTTLTLAPLQLPDLQQLAADTLHTDAEKVAALAQLLLDKTNGNPFFVFEFFSALFHQGAVSFDPHEGRWQWDEQAIRQMEITDNVAELMSHKLETLPENTQTVLQLAACIGNQFDLATLATIANKSQRATAADLGEALASGIIVPTGQTGKHLKLLQTDIEEARFDEFEFGFRFLHHRVQQAAYARLSDDARQQIHLTLGRFLNARLLAQEREEHIFELVNHFNNGIAHLTDPQERLDVAALHLLAGRKSKSSTAYEQALTYLHVGLQLLPGNSWHTHYQLTYDLRTEQAEAEYLAGNAERAREQCSTLMNMATSPLDQARLYEIIFHSYVAQKRFQDGLDVGLRALKMLGVSLPDKPNKLHILGALARVQAKIGFRRPSDLVNLPAMRDPAIQRVMHILMLTSTLAYQMNPDLLVLIGLTMVRLSLKYGNTAASSYGYLVYALIRTGVLGHIDAGKAYGQLGLHIMETCVSGKIRGKNLCLYNIFLRHWDEPLRNTLAPLLEGADAAREVGDPEFQGYNYFFHSQARFVLGDHLELLEEEYARHQQTFMELKQEISQNVLAILFQTVLNLRAKAGEPTRLVGDAFNIDAPGSLPSASSHFYAAFYQGILHFLFRNPLEAATCMNRARPYLEAVMAMNVIPLFHFYDTLILLAVYPSVSRPQKAAYRLKILMNRRKFNKWARYAPENQQHRFELIEAEMARVFGRYHQAIGHYEQAIRLSREHGYTPETALACELAAEFYHAIGSETMFRHYLTRAYTGYRAWGALAKTHILEHRHPFVLEPLSVHDTSQTTPTTSLFRQSSLSGSSSGMSKTLDLETVMKASQAISSEILLDNLLTTLLNVVMENAGAERGFLLREKDGQWGIEARCSTDGVPVHPAETPDTPDMSALLPVSIINYVARTKETVVLRDAAHETQFLQDAYILAHAPKSVLCLPLLHQGQVKAILYLENNLTEGAFTADRLKVLNMLSAQMIISIENATLYGTLEQKVAERTAELAESNVQLARANEEALEAKHAAEEAQRVAEAANRSKSTFLANMSHELRTPLNAILGFSELMLRDAHTTETQRESLETINRSGEHLLGLINDVLELSKIEAGRVELLPENFNLHKLLLGLEEMFRLRAQQKGLTLTFERAPDVPPYVRADQNKLRQILINLLGNAIKFTEEGKVRLKIENCQLNIEEGREQEGSRQSPQPVSGQASIIQFSITDTGVGISNDELKHVFEAFVQTSSGRQSQQGTGLGMPISREFARLMGGDLRVQSQVGKGTTFTLDVPVEIVEAGDVPDAQPARRVIGLEPGQPAYRLLIAEDVDANRKLLIKLLQPLGFDVRVACDGQEAVDVWREWRPHLIWMDIRMPVMDGHEATKLIKSEIRNSPSAIQTVIIALTASAFEEQRAEALDAGCDDFVRKPFRENQLLDMLHKHLGVRYVYEEEQPAEEAAEQPKDLTREQLQTELATVSPELLAVLEDVLELSDMEAIEQAIAAIREHNPPVANALMKLAAVFAYDELLTLVQNVNS